MLDISKYAGLMTEQNKVKVLFSASPPAPLISISQVIGWEEHIQKACCLSICVCNVGGLWSHQFNKNRKSAHDTIGWSLVYLHAKVNPDCSFQ